MQNTIKPTTIAYIVAAFLVPFLLSTLLGLGRDLAVIVYTVMIIVFGILALRSYRAGGATGSAIAAPSSTSAAGKPSRLGFGLVGAALGFGVGYLTRPTFLGEPIPLRAMFDPVPQELESVKTNFIMHMGIATAIGLVAAVVLVQILISVRKA